MSYSCPKSGVQAASGTSMEEKLKQFEEWASIRQHHIRVPFSNAFNHPPPSIMRSENPFAKEPREFHGI
ncbi:unnamed protein product [Heligmosomoides polygyrus]|uniref:TPX2 domain-containing protein n=1 Tax=Heligmosomoides polygyrus TaxID=6339 RepID=A0A183FWJ9_HELPZ|nr:unnamed protein product [Heligmosomoides polygyrus]